MVVRNDEEHQHQVALFRWAKIEAKTRPVLNMLFAVPNAGKRTLQTAARMKAEGLKAGVPDVLLPAARGNYAGLAIEMKSKVGKLTDSQKEWRDMLLDEGWSWHLIRDWADARDVVVNYLKLPKPTDIGTN